MAGLTGVGEAIAEHVRAFNERDLDALMAGFTELVETLSWGGERHTFHIAGFYRLRDGRIAAAKIYREGSAELP